MDIASFINSRDIREYLKEINYDFTSLEAAWLIYQCRSKALKEKQAAWQEIIDNMPDCSVKERPNCIEIKSLHAFLKDYMALQKRMYEDLKLKEEGFVYIVTLKYDSYENDFRLCSSYEKCLEYMKTVNDEDDLAEIKVEKRKVDDEHESILAFYNRKLELTGIESPSRFGEEVTDLQYYTFDGLWFNFPTPFKKGDILIDPERPESNGLCRGPVVCEEAGQDPDTEKGRKYIERMKESADTSDMDVWGYFQNEYGQLYSEVTDNYMDFEFYRGDLSGKKRLLKAMSNYLKGEIDAELLMLASHQIITEENIKEARPLWFTKEGMELAGMGDEEDKK